MNPGEIFEGKSIRENIILGQDFLKDRYQDIINSLDLCLEDIPGEDFAELGLLAHWLKGAGGTVGFDPYNEPAKELELAAKAANGVRAAHYLAEIEAITGAVVAPSEAISGGFMRLI